ncbi:discoidin domain-containing protein [Nocardia australiensis]|uniref:discoidin domain-containing protein n=1 Tax=Nocardia australiensis TaxID=2887191 RepID=UPI001D148236|nr:discoidin domain-containing protein [Nocardia australiensis]
MPDEDPGDIFLRHRGAVLDTLLSDPSFGPAGIDSYERASAGAASVGLLEAESNWSEPVDRPRASGGPKASERILALLNGQAEPDSTAAYTQEFRQPAAVMPAEAEAEDPPRTPAAEPAAASSSNRFGPADQVARDTLTQLRKPKVALAIGAVVAVLVVLLLVTTGGKKQESDQVLVVTAPPTTAAPSTTGPPAVASGVIPIKSAQAKCPPGSTSAMDAFGGETGKAWACVRAYKVDGQVMTIDLGKSYQIDSIGVIPGWDHVSADGTDQWDKYRTASRIHYELDNADASGYTQATLDQRTLVVTKIEPPVSATRITLTILESKGDRSINTTAISSIVITGH